jgi:hypothetical protein
MLGMQTTEDESLFAIEESERFDVLANTKEESLCSIEELERSDRLAALLRGDLQAS